MGKKRRKKQQTKLAIDQIEARSLVLVDEYGNQRANISCSGGEDGVSGYVGIQLTDHTGRPVISIQVDDEGNSNIQLCNVNNSSGVSMAVSERGNGLSINNSEGKPCIMMGAPGPKSDNPDAPSPRVAVLDTAKKKIWQPFTGTNDLIEKEA
ncbi:hypothetical protein OAF74_01755 [bacterium]|nr:hypothetical protein [bacterium]